MGQSKSLRDAVMAALPIYLGTVLVDHNIDAVWATLFAAAVFGFIARSYRLLRARMPQSATIAWLFGVDPNAPRDIV